MPRPAVDVVPVSPPAPVGPVVPPEPVELVPPSGDPVIVLIRPLMAPVQPANRVTLTIPRLKRLVKFQGSLRIVGVVPPVTFHQADRSRKIEKKCTQPI